MSALAAAAEPERFRDKDTVQFLWERKALRFTCWEDWQVARFELKLPGSREVVLIGKSLLTELGIRV